ncbi:MAG: hypothetical protein JSU74_08980 [Candidatus Zixiibacteriota bacterium]|nr:MAG: hypothetical protein JSU74_08980 [candidate division Zixibacteria bacterium]
MPARFYHRTRLVHFIAAVVVLTLLFTIWLSFYRFTLLVAVPSLLLGYWLGSIDWRRQERRIDKRNGLILYFSDSYAYFVLVMLYLFTLPGGRSFVGRTLSASPWVFPVLTWFTAAVASGYNLAFYIGVRRFESERGPLRVKRFYARSAVGAESLIGKTGTVQQDCDPNGTVKIENAIWSAESIDGSALTAGSRVVVKDIEGLKVFVELIP